MCLRSVFRPRLAAIVLAWCLPLTLWHGVMYATDYKVSVPIGKPNHIYSAWRVHPVPPAVYLAFALYESIIPKQRLMADPWIRNEAVTIAASVN